MKTVTGKVVEARVTKEKGGPVWKRTTIEKIRIRIECSGGEQYEFLTPDLAGVNGPEWRAVHAGETIVVRGGVVHQHYGLPTALVRVRLIKRVVTATAPPPPPPAGADPWQVMTDLDTMLGELTSKRIDAVRAAIQMRDLQKQTDSLRWAMDALDAKMADAAGFVQIEAEKQIAQKKA